jgi:hypothetical protein
VVAVNLPGRDEEKYKIVGILFTIGNRQLPSRVRSVNVGENMMGTGGR